VRSLRDVGINAGISDPKRHHQTKTPASPNPLHLALPSPARPDL